MVSKCIISKTKTCQTKGSGGHLNGLLATNDGHCAKSTNKTELEFYRDVYKKNLPLAQVIPEFNGICEYNNEYRLLLENVKKNYKDPCEIDIKLGKYSAYLDELINKGDPVIHSIIKTIRMRIGDSLTASDQFNYRVAGGNFSNISKQDIKLYDSNSLIDKYLNDNKVLMKNLVKHLENIKDKLISTSKNQNLMLIGLSVYILYEKTNPNKCNVYLIDFAHSKLVEKKHESQKYCLNGLTNLINKINDSL